DAVVRRDGVAGQLASGADVEAPTAVGEADDGSLLLLGPPENRQIPARPVLNDLGDPAVGIAVILLLQSQQADVPRMAGREARHLDVIAKQVVGPGQGADLPLEVTLLVIPARAPAQTAADVEVLAQDVPHHVLGRDALGRALVVSAAGGV